MYMTTAKFQLTTLYYTKHCTSVKTQICNWSKLGKKEEENETDFFCEVASEGEKENVAPSCLHKLQSLFRHSVHIFSTYSFGHTCPSFSNRSYKKASGEHWIRPLFTPQREIYCSE
jgi:hypothetical protein